MFLWPQVQTRSWAFFLLCDVVGLLDVPASLPPFPPLSFPAFSSCFPSLLHFSSANTLLWCPTWWVTPAGEIKSVSLTPASVHRVWPLALPSQTYNHCMDGWQKNEDEGTHLLGIWNSLRLIFLTSWGLRQPSDYPFRECSQPGCEGSFGSDHTRQCHHHLSKRP